MRIQDPIFAASLVALTFSATASVALACAALLLHFAPTPTQPPPKTKHQRTDP